MGDGAPAKGLQIIQFGSAGDAWRLSGNRDPGPFGNRLIFFTEKSPSNKSSPAIFTQKLLPRR
jgi:hypothetical protein